MLKVSVIVPTYNHEKYIKKCIESIVMQKCDFAFEVLIGDDASKDKTGMIVAEYASKYPEIIKPILRKRNLGGFKNMYDLFQKARGEYIAFIDGDDYWISKDKLQKQVDFLDKNKDYEAVFAKSMVVDKEGGQIIGAENYMPFFKGGDYKLSNINENVLPGQTSTALYRKSALKKFEQRLREDRRIRPRGQVLDVFLILGVYSQGKIYTICEEMAAYRFVMEKDSGSWNSKYSGYGLINMVIFLAELHELERVGKVLGVDLNYNERRKYEYRKANDYKGRFPGITIYLIKFFIVLWYKNKKELIIPLRRRMNI